MSDAYNIACPNTHLPPGCSSSKKSCRMTCCLLSMGSPLATKKEHCFSTHPRSVPPPPPTPHHTPPQHPCPAQKAGTQGFTPWQAQGVTGLMPCSAAALSSTLTHSLTRGWGLAGPASTAAPCCLQPLLVLLPHPSTSQLLCGASSCGWYWHVLGRGGAGSLWGKDSAVPLSSLSKS